jgi:hypothetical protein
MERSVPGGMNQPSPSGRQFSQDSVSQEFSIAFRNVHGGFIKQ